MGMIGYDMRIKRTTGKTFWKALEGIIGKLLSKLGSGLKQAC